MFVRTYTSMVHKYMCTSHVIYIYTHITLATRRLCEPLCASAEQQRLFTASKFIPPPVDRPPAAAPPKCTPPL